MVDCRSHKRARRRRARRGAERRHLRDADIDTIFTSVLQRSFKTAEPFAQLRKLPVNRIDPHKGKELVARLKKENPKSRVLIVAHSNTVPDFLEAYGAPRPPDIPDTEYDNLWVITPSEKGPARIVRLHL
jgi:broad specificity phosphatase PhoE